MYACAKCSMDVCVKFLFIYYFYEFCKRGGKRARKEKSVWPLTFNRDFTREFNRDTFHTTRSPGCTRVLPGNYPGGFEGKIPQKSTGILPAILPARPFILQDLPGAPGCTRVKFAKRERGIRSLWNHLKPSKSQRFSTICSIWTTHQFIVSAVSHSCVRSNCCISWRISFKFCMEVYLGKIYTPIVFGDAAPSVPSFIWSKVIFWWKSCVRSAGDISWWISFKFCIDVHHSQIDTPVVFGDAAPSVPSFIGSKVIVWFTFLCAL